MTEYTKTLLEEFKKEFDAWEDKMCIKYGDKKSNYKDDDYLNQALGHATAHFKNLNREFNN